MAKEHLSSHRAARVAAKLLRVRWFARAPIWLFRARLGFLAGSRLVMLEHIGRTTGARRYVVLEVVDQPSPGNYIVASGFGERAQWFRNIRANKAVRVYVGSRPPRAAVAHVLGPVDSRKALDAYARKHPRTWRTLRPVLESTLQAKIDEAGTNLPLVWLDTNEPTPAQNDSQPWKARAS